MQVRHIPIFVPHRGCPHDCVFCNQRHITGHIQDTTTDDVKRIINENLSTMSPYTYIEVAFFGGSFTAIDLEQQTELLSAAYSYLKEDKINGIRCSTRPDCITPDILENFKKYGGIAIELGVQSTDEDVLKKSRRGHTWEDVVKAAEMIKEYNLELGVQMMLGLPGDTEEKMLKTAGDLISLKPDCVRIYPTLVVEDTALWNMYQKGDYVPLTVEKATDILASIIPMFENAGVEVIRVGLQTTEEINENTVKGPYHPAIKELAMGKVIRNAVEKYISYAKNGVLEVFCNPREVSLVAGHKKSNRDYFYLKHHVKLKIIASSELQEGQLKICDKNIAF